MANPNRQTVAVEAKQMANAPLPEVQTNALPRVPFQLLGFSADAKRTLNKNDDGSTSRRMARAKIGLAGTPIHFSASIYIREQIEKTASGTQLQRRTYCSMPSTGKNFPRPVFETDDTRMADAITAFRREVVDAYRKWQHEQTGTTKPAASRDDGFVEYEAVEQPA